MKTTVRSMTALAALLVAIPLRAETRVGILGGANFATLNFSRVDPEVSLRSKTFFGAGILVETVFSDKLSLQLEPMFLEKGGKIEIRDFFGENAVGSLRFSYIELPVLLRLSKPSGKARPYLILGPSVGYRFRAKAKDEITGEETDVDEDIEKWDFGVGAGGGLSVPAGRASVFVEGRYTWGLTNVNKADEDIKIKNRGAQVLAGVAFGVGAH